GKVAVVTDVNADASIRSVETRIPEISGPEIKLLPETRIDVRNVVLAILAEILSIRVDHRGSVVIDPSEFLFVDRHDDNHAVFLRDVLHQSHSWTIGDAFDGFIPARLLFGTKIRSRKDLLHADYLHLLLRRILNELQVFLDIQTLDLLERK